jgi:Immunoglobulin I-set domain
VCTEDFVSLNAVEGSSVSLECELAAVKDEHSVKWLKDGGEVALNNSSYKPRYGVDAKDYKLTIGEVALEDEGVYDCVVYSKRGEFVIKSKRRFKLTVADGLCKSNYEQFSSFKESGHVLVSCSKFFSFPSICFNSIILIVRQITRHGLRFYNFCAIARFSTSQIHHKAAFDEERGSRLSEQSSLQGVRQHQSVLDQRAGRAVAG